LCGNWAWQRGNWPGQRQALWKYGVHRYLLCILSDQHNLI
jgi:hypothetical protein